MANVPHRFEHPQLGDVVMASVPQGIPLVTCSTFTFSADEYIAVVDVFAHYSPCVLILPSVSDPLDCPAVSQRVPCCTVRPKVHDVSHCGEVVVTLAPSFYEFQDI